jgi:hypothetical protein
MDGRFREVVMLRSFSSLWTSPPLDLPSRIERFIDPARDLVGRGEARYIFFRVDDVAVPGKQFVRLMELFTRYRVPLSLAVVPAWLTGSRWESLKGLTGKNPSLSSLWCWHQHGWRHLNHEVEGKKQEFGGSRSPSQIREDLVRGRHRLEIHMGEDFYPVFTAPWNRCSSITLELLKELGYHAVSRSKGSLPPAPEGLPDFQVNVDLHTRKEVDAEEGWDGLFAELKGALLSGLCGIMIHHRRMNDVAFDFLEVLLQKLSRHEGLRIVNFKDLVAMP